MPKKVCGDVILLTVVLIVLGAVLGAVIQSYEVQHEWQPSEFFSFGGVICGALAAVFLSLASRFIKFKVGPYSYIPWVGFLAGIALGYFF